MLENIISIPVLSIAFVFALLTVIINYYFIQDKLKKIALVRSCEEIGRLYFKKTGSGADANAFLIEYRQDTLRKVSRSKKIKMVILGILILSIFNVVLISIVRFNSYNTNSISHELSSVELLFRIIDPIQILWSLLTLCAYIMAKHRATCLYVLLNKLDELLLDLKSSINPNSQKT